ncbi:unnamed protein product [Rhizoctonia solani]|uniref:Uncharacterized protein n=1 Tax=Rhizoctonia solani TaxID=456999 RepID=A0A8H3E6T8_9AGAM|nr:unnamed protein product [Rhizoctonia solani]
MFEPVATAAKRNRKLEDPHLSTKVPPGSPTEVAEIDSDSDIREFIRRKKAEENFCDGEVQDDSFDFLSKNRRDPAVPPTYESCIKFVDELPSEKVAREAREA